MHDDEVRPLRQARRLLTAEISRDPADALERLGEQQRRIRELEAKARQMTTQLRSASAARTKLGQQVQDLRSELELRTTTPDVQEPVEAAASDAAGDAAGRVETDAAPVDAPPLAGDAPSAGAEDATSAAADAAPESGAGGAVDQSASGATEPADDKDLSEESTEQLLLRVEADPGAALLAICLNRLWYADGALEQCLTLLVRHADVVPDMTPQQRKLAERIWGTAALEEALSQIVPPRSRGAAYLPERDRVMYCAYSTPAFHSNGYSVRTQGVVSGLKTAGADVFVVGRSGYPWDIRGVPGTPARRRRHTTTIDGVDYVHMPEGDLARTRADEYVQVAADAFVREARVRRPSLIHAASNFLNALPALIAARRLGLPFVYEVRGLWEVTEASKKKGWEQTERYAWQARMEAFVASQADAVLAITQETKDELVRRGVPAERIELLPNGVDTESFLPIPRDEAFAKARGLSGDVPVIGFAGSFVEYEGLDLLLQAANILRGRKVRFQIALAGGGGVYPQLKSYKERNKLGSRVRFVGRRAPEEIPRFLSCVDIVACPRQSLPVTEMVSPLKPLEAFAASKPTVLSDVSPHRTLVGEDQQRGLLFEPGSPKALADALQELIEDAELRTAKGRAGRLWVVDERRWPDLGRMVREVHRTAQALHLRDAAQGREASQLRIGLIADEFTTKTLQRAAQIVVLDRDGFEGQLRDEVLDLVLIESAWNGNGGQWHRGIGAYSEEEDASLVQLLESCRRAEVPTVFWNKEDPVHIERFRRTGARVDHVFTTDADMIGEYLRHAHESADGAAATASSLPFYADPAVHNPLPSARPYEDSIAYAGTFYGERYAQRSHQLEQLLAAAKEAADGRLAIYDRQQAIPDSPYRFPPEYSDDIRGSLPYDEVLDSYKSHIANLNVNSVAESPTMFSRRVVEIAASGAVVMSAWSRGITETFDGRIPTTNNDMYWRAYLSAWVHDPQEHLREAWLQMRAVLRSHTVQTALVLMARTAGIPVHGPQLPAWGCDLSEADAEHVLAQSVLPTAVRVGASASALRQRAVEAGITVIDSGAPLPSGIDWWAQPPFAMGRTWAEDMLWATLWGDWDAIASRAQGPDHRDGRIIAAPGGVPEDSHGSMLRCTAGVRTGTTAPAEAVRPLTLTMPAAHHADADEGVPAVQRQPSSSRPQGPVLVAGHDLKFARSWIDHLRAQGVEVLLDEWENHAEHDEQRSLELLRRAETVFCEWGLGNAVWYSRHVRRDQRLVVRVHAQELRRPYLQRIHHAAVDEYVFVGELMRDAAVRSHGVPRAKTRVIPNIVRAGELDRPKTPEARFTLGLVGIVPQIKRLDRAVTVIESLAAQDERWTLRIKGRRPEDYAWMLRREDEMAWYQDCYRRIDRLHEATGRRSVIFDPHGDDMAQWFQGVGYALSVSDLESFHLTLPDGAASGAAPISLAWPGADLIYPREWLVGSLQDMSARIRSLQADDVQREDLEARASDFVRRRMDESVVHAALDRALTEEEVLSR
ncbi:UNVERIFIED_CONTAM: glycosyltransferase [Kocuria sp. CPCC 205295]|uniref:glycosyltransferase n=1 Tax=Kocuria sp. CPCC 205295 TaxID=3073557 RepID=UPI0036DDA5B6